MEPLSDKTLGELLRQSVESPSDKALGVTESVGPPTDKSLR
jgi:hypothetical protein